MKEFSKERYCNICGSVISHAEVDEKGLCGPCGLRYRMNKLPPAGSRCVLCGERRRRNLTTWPLSGDPVCHSCEFYLKETRPYPKDPRSQKGRLKRERRARERDMMDGKSTESDTCGSESNADGLDEDTVG